jgi:hypothetical protein
MARPPRLSLLVLAAAGVVLLVCGVAAVALGLLNPRLISDQLPPDAAIDAPAVGGAAVALGVAVILLALIHLVTVAALRRGIGMARTAGVVLAATMAVLSLGFAVAAVVSIASGSAPAIIMLPASGALGAAAVAYAATTMAIIGAPRPTT